MSKLDDARTILASLDVPTGQQSDMCSYVLLSLAEIRKRSRWDAAENPWKRIHDMIAFIRENYGVSYAENSRETIRKQALHHFRNAAFIEDNGEATNSPNYRYRLTDEMLELMRSYGSKAWKTERDRFLEKHTSLIDQYSTKRSFRLIPVKINGQDFSFSTGSHNKLQKAIVEEFAQRFAPNSQCLYIGDSSDKELVKDEEKLREIGFTVSIHDTMPDVVLFSQEKNWLYFIEAVTSVGPMDPKRIKEIEKMCRGITAGRIYVTAFPDFKTFKKFSEQLAWDTEVWIAEMPDHMIHLNGDMFLGPRQR